MFGFSVVIFLKPKKGRNGEVAAWHFMSQFPIQKWLLWSLSGCEAHPSVLKG